MGDAAAAAIQPTLYVILNCLFLIMLEYFILAFGVDVIGLSCIDIICLSTSLISMIGFSTVYMIMLYQFIIQIKSYGLLLIFSTLADTIMVFYLFEYANLCGTCIKFGGCCFIYKAERKAVSRRI